QARRAPRLPQRPACPRLEGASAPRLRGADRHRERPDGHADPAVFPAPRRAAVPGVHQRQARPRPDALRGDRPPAGRHPDDRRLPVHGEPVDRRRPHSRAEPASTRHAPQLRPGGGHPVNSTRSTSLPALSTLLGDALPTVLADCLPRTGEGVTIERVTGGNVSHVFRVRGHLGKAIIKVRTDTFARIPQLHTDPALIADERRALDLYGTVAPGHFPQVLGFHDTLHTMVLSDVFP